jgi:hypothetical protein
MTVPTPTPARTKIFLSYRRSDTSGHVGRLYDELVGYFGRDRVFMDIDGISPGQNFVDVLTERLRDAAVVLVLIAARTPQLSILPALLGFLLYKPAVILQAVFDT